jgi:hypothetical protein
MNVDPARKIREESLFFVKHNLADTAGVSGVQSLASVRPIRLSRIKRLPLESSNVGSPQPQARHSGRRCAGQSPCQAAPIIVIVVQTISDPAMHCVLFFTRHFYFSDSSPKAVE